MMEGEAVKCRGINGVFLVLFYDGAEGRSGGNKRPGLKLNQPGSIKLPTLQRETMNTFEKEACCVFDDIFKTIFHFEIIYCSL